MPIPDDNVFSEYRIFFIKSKSEYVTEELSMCWCNKDERTKTHEKNVMFMVFKGLKRERMTL